uniref:Uncharacterized protein n=1 Tax=Athene cunicularia TaxID=194338 RepID=A0A663MTH9_ATHCN
MSNRGLCRELGHSLSAPAECTAKGWLFQVQSAKRPVRAITGPHRTSRSAGMRAGACLCFITHRSLVDTSKESQAIS